MAHRSPKNEVDGPFDLLARPAAMMIIRSGGCLSTGGAGAGDMRPMRGYSTVMPSLSTASAGVGLLPRVAAGCRFPAPSIRRDGESPTQGGRDGYTAGRIARRMARRANAA